MTAAAPQTVEDIEAQLRTLEAEQQSLPEAARSALTEGQDKEYARLRNRETILPHLITAARVRLLKARAEQLEARDAEIAATVPALNAALDQALAALREAEAARNLAAAELHTAHEDRRDISRERGRLKLELDQLLSQAGRRTA